MLIFFYEKLTNWEPQAKRGHNSWNKVFWRGEPVFSSKGSWESPATNVFNSKTDNFDTFWQFFCERGPFARTLLILKPVFWTVLDNISGKLINWEGWAKRGHNWWNKVFLRLYFLPMEVIFFYCIIINNCICEPKRLLWICFLFVIIYNNSYPSWNWLTKIGKIIIYYLHWTELVCID